MWVLLLSPLSSKKGRKGDCSKPVPTDEEHRSMATTSKGQVGEREKGTWEEQKIIYIKKVT